ncbi:substrate-binding domain-containing protein [Lysinibacter cavernae]|uniref:DNA-binding LacI/PurR family transcriptional regulator n=1 Tax=Lysinibacter cavernae TaxID=1640652 RepID=A0A7X5QZX8_9MICO|nr:DNA-binding LacI/PurR family transcriptional regulator [Lysinibacter cavernae]
MATIADVAKLAGVAKATASRALSGQGYVAPATRERVADAAHALGYIASANASGLATGRSQSIAVLIPLINRWFLAEVLQGLESALLAAGYDMTVYNVSHMSANRSRVFDFFLVRRSFDAVILVGIDASATELETIQRLDKPVACVGAPIDGLDSYVLDDYRAAQLATEHLLGLGHTKIVFVGGPQNHFHDNDPASSLVHSDRFRGYSDAMTLAGHAAAITHAPTPLDLESGRQAGRRWLAHPDHPVTAVLAESDEVAFGVILAAQELGKRVPSDVSIVGIDGHDYAETFGLTTVQQNPQQLGMSAVSDLLERVTGDDERRHPSPVAPDFVVRHSTTAPPR